MMRTRITSKGKAQENIGKESLVHLSAFIPRNMDTPTEAQTSIEMPVYRMISLR